MEKTFANKLREWTLFENAHPGNLRGVIRQAAEEIESLTAERDRLRKALERVRDDIDENYDQFIGMPLLIRNSTIEEVRKTLKGAN